MQAVSACVPGPGPPSSPALLSSYEEYVLKSHLLSKMYLQQYCGQAPPAPANTKPQAKGGDCAKKEKPKKGGEGGKLHSGSKKKEHGSLLDSPLDLSTRHLESAHAQEALAIKDRLYSANFPFASLQQMLLHSGQAPACTSPPAKPEKAAKAASCPRVSPPPAAAESGKDLSYVCPICGQMFALHDR